MAQSKTQGAVAVGSSAVLPGTRSQSVLVCAEQPLGHDDVCEQPISHLYPTTY